MPVSGSPAVSCTPSASDLYGPASNKTCTPHRQRWPDFSRAVASVADARRATAGFYPGAGPVRSAPTVCRVPPSARRASSSRATADDDSCHRSGSGARSPAAVGSPRCHTTGRARRVTRHDPTAARAPPLGSTHLRLDNHLAVEAPHVPALCQGAAVATQRPPALCASSSARCDLSCRSRTPRSASKSHCTSPSSTIRCRVRTASWALRPGRKPLRTRQAVLRVERLQHLAHGVLDLRVLTRREAHRPGRPRGCGAGGHVGAAAGDTAASSAARADPGEAPPRAARPVPWGPPPPPPRRLPADGGRRV